MNLHKNPQSTNDKRCLRSASVGQKKKKKKKKKKERKSRRKIATNCSRWLACPLNTPAYLHANEKKEKRKIIRPWSSRDFLRSLSTANYTCTGAERRARLLRITQCRATNEAFQGNAKSTPAPRGRKQGGASRSLKNEEKKYHEKKRERKGVREEKRDGPCGVRASELHQALRRVMNKG